MKTLKCFFLVTGVVLMLVLAPGSSWVVSSSSQPNLSTKFEAEATAPISQDIPQPVKDLINQAFKTVSAVSVPFVNQINQWLNDANSAAKKTVSDFTSCPSPAAQNLYNDLKTKRTNLNQTIAVAKQADLQAQQARATCLTAVPSVPIDFRPQCYVAYNNLPFAATKVGAEGARDALQHAMNVLTSLKCISGCNKTGKLTYPTASLVSETMLNVNRLAQDVIETANTNPRADVLPAAPRSTSGRLDATVCTAWDFGAFGVNLDAVGSGDFSKMFGYRSPGCSRTERLSVCTNWNMSVLLPKLKELRIVPPGVQLPDVEIVVPNKTLTVVSNVAKTTCKTPVKICTRPSGSLVINFNVGSNPLDILSTSACDQTQTIGCSNPMFGLAPTYSTIEVPDLRRATIKIKPGTFTPATLFVDLTRPEFKIACSGNDLEVPLPTTLKFGTQVIDLPYVCTEPRFVSLVANP